MKDVVTAVGGITLLMFSAFGCEARGETLGPRGGTVVSEDGRFVLEVPESALSQEVDVSIAQVACVADVLTDCYAVEPRGTAFRLPAQVTFELGGMELGTMDPRALGFVVERDTGWNMLADRHVDMEDQVVTASALYLSSFAVVPVATEESPDEELDE